MVGGSYQGRRTGSWGDAGAFSFNYYKIISAGGEGGCLVTNDRTLYERALVYHDSGSAFRPKAGTLTIPIFVAQQYRADEVMGAIARVQLQRMDGIIGDLRRVHRSVTAAMSGMNNLHVAPSNDPEGDCGVTAAFQFDNEAMARRFATAKEVGGLVVIDHGKHVYTCWEPLRAKRIGHHPDMNPFFFPQNRGLRADYSDTACPRTLEILRRTVFVSMNPDWDAGRVQARVDALQAAARGL